MSTASSFIRHILARCRRQEERGERLVKVAAVLTLVGPPAKRSLACDAGFVSGFRILLRKQCLGGVECLWFRIELSGENSSVTGSCCGFRGNVDGFQPRFRSFDVTGLFCLKTLWEGRVQYL